MFKDEIIISEIKQLKCEIDEFMSELSKYTISSGLPILKKSDLDFFSFLSKQIVFLKNIYISNNDRRLKVLVSDYYNFIICVIKNHYRYAYVNERSIIENYIRYITETKIEDDHITNNSFVVLREKHYKFDFNDDEFALIKSEYAMSCGYIHGSIILDDRLAYIFEECIANEQPIKNKNKYYDRIKKMIKTFNKMIISEQSEFISSVFHRRKSILGYLIGKDCIDFLFKILE